ncbi:uncharacterized protein LOC124406579 [Diprion similis]|uniref:uncharacterized protein LOC124406579 n=1 Tax=Diprion similis TaxID=362088 RepID=UPI001EF7B72E|nr:uncharacterized protein LOC124406579 [Diprion similis]
MSFVRSRTNKLSFGYTIQGTLLEKVDTIKDLGIVYQSNFEFEVHLRAATSKAFKLLGFIKRSTKEFKLFLIKELEFVQHRFFRFIAFKMRIKIKYDDHDYSALASSLNLESLKSLHVHHDLVG